MEEITKKIEKIIAENNVVLYEGYIIHATVWTPVEWQEY